MILAITLPSPALAEVCDKEVPTWAGWPATALDAALAPDRPFAYL
jgi:hypothetical protein